MLTCLKFKRLRETGPQARQGNTEGIQTEAKVEGNIPEFKLSHPKARFMSIEQRLEERGGAAETEQKKIRKKAKETKPASELASQPQP